MLKAEINRETGTCIAMASGNLKEILNDMATLVNGVYSRIALGGHPEVANEFRRTMVLLHLDPSSGLFEVNQTATGMTIVVPKKEG